MTPVVEAQGLRKVFRAKEKPPGLLGSLRSLVRPTYRTVEAVRGIDFTIAPGEMVAFIGPNGAGKSTTIKMLTGILYPTSGTARVLGLVPWERRQELVYRIAAVFGQRSQLWYHLPPIDSFELLARIYELDRADYRRRLAALIERFDIAAFLHTPVRKLSLGERMRCELVGALLHRPAVLFLDEPTIGLDVVARQRIRAHLRELNETEGTTVFLTSHDAGDIEQLCRRVIVISHGTVIFDDSMEALKRRFIPTKVIELKLEESADKTPAHTIGAELPGVRVIRREDYVLTLEVETARQSIEVVVGRILATCRVADVTISDPPLEEIIAAIYAGRGTARGNDANGVPAATVEPAREAAGSLGTPKAKEAETKEADGGAPCESLSSTPPS
jgi:ABC-2 type transport system ATP-binding protein